MGNGSSTDDLQGLDSRSQHEVHDSHDDNPIIPENQLLQQKSPSPTHKPNTNSTDSTTLGASVITTTSTTASSSNNNNNNSDNKNNNGSSSSSSQRESKGNFRRGKATPSSPPPPPPPTTTATTITCTPNSRRSNNRKRANTIETNRSNKSSSSLSTITRSSNDTSGNTPKITNNKKVKDKIANSTKKYPSTAFYSNKHKKNHSINKSASLASSRTIKSSTKAPPTTSSHLEAVLLRRKRKAQMQSLKQSQGHKEKNTSGSTRRHLYANARNQDVENPLIGVTSTKIVTAGSHNNEKKQSVMFSDQGKEEQNQMNSTKSQGDQREQKDEETNTAKEKNRSRQRSANSSIFSVLAGVGGGNNNDNDKKIITNTNIDLNYSYDNNSNNNNTHNDLSYDDDNESSLTSNVSLNTSTMSQSTTNTNRSSKTEEKALKRAMKEEEVRHRIKRLGKSDKKKMKELAMRDKLNQLSNKDPPSLTDGVLGGGSLAGGSHAVTAEDEGITNGGGLGTPTGRTLSYYKDRHNPYDDNDRDNNEEEKREITKDISPYEVRRVYDSVIAESNLGTGSGKRTFIQHLSEKFESLLPPNEVDVKNPGKFADKPNTKTPTSPELLEQNMYSSFLDGSNGGGGHHSSLSKSKGDGKNENDTMDEQSDVSSVSQFFEEDQLL